MNINKKVCIGLANFDKDYGITNKLKKQQDLTELNSDGNRQRGRYGEDESHLKPEEDEKDSKENTKSR
mgnify:CR=1 FL=1